MTVSPELPSELGEDGCFRRFDFFFGSLLALDEASEDEPPELLSLPLSLPLPLELEPEPEPESEPEPELLPLSDSLPLPLAELSSSLELSSDDRAIVPCVTACL